MDKIAEFLPSLLKKAGKIMLEAHEIGSSVSSKSGNANFVTEFDTKVQDFLISSIKKEIPYATFMAEEQENDAAVINNQCCFVIDPIDGTTNFIYNYHHSCISVAVISYGEPVVGAVYDPYLDELFMAQKGKGASLNGAPMQVSQTPLSGALVAFGSAPYYRNELGDLTMGLLKELYMNAADVRRCGSAALDLAYLAAGRNDVFFEARLSPWDYAVGYLLITEAGGIISQINGDPVNFSAPQSILASNAVAYDELLAIAKKHIQ